MTGLIDPEELPFTTEEVQTCLRCDMKYETWHWRVYNLQWRIFGLMAVTAGAA
jgi:hypothetical protein